MVAKVAEVRCLDLDPTDAGPAIGSSLMNDFNYIVEDEIPPSRSSLFHVLASALLTAGMLAPAGAVAQSTTFPIERSDNPMQDRNAYLLTLLDGSPAARAALSGQASLRDIAERLKTDRDAVSAACQLGKICPLDRLMLSDAEIASVGKTLIRLSVAGAPLASLVRDKMRPSGRFQKLAALSDPELMRAAWEETAQGINRLYRIYSLGEAPRYAALDSMTFKPSNPDFIAMEADALDTTRDHSGHEGILHVWADVGFDLLLINQRDEAERYEPLEKVENGPSFARAKSTDWKAWRYAAIIVPGEGLLEGERGLSPVGALRIRIAVERWRNKLAPFILVSGGHVHPDRTPYAEAIEMKRVLITQYGVPVDAIIVDPYARHTTTNLRNAARLLFSMSAPPAQPVMITTTSDQSSYIESRDFAQRCEAELGYEPMVGLKRLSPFDLTGTINIVSLHADMQDPLDP